MNPVAWSPLLTWSLFGLMALVALALILVPLWRKQQDTSVSDDRMAAYKRQLQEIGLEEARGLLTPEAARAARLEVERRILRLEAPEIAKNSGGQGVMIGAGVTAIVAAVALYFGIGQPGFPDHPAPDFGKQKLDAGSVGASNLNELLDKLITYLDQNPEEAEGWAHLRRASLNLGRHSDYSAALSRAVAKRPDNIDLRVLYAESLIMMSSGRVTPAARLALNEAAAIEPRHPAIGYYAGMALMQDNKPSEAEAVWQKLLAESPEDAEWREQIIEKIAEAEQAQGKSGDDAAAAIAALPADEQQAQIRAMVEGLAARLEDEPDNADGWLRLGRAWRVLGEHEKAQNALEQARKAAEAQQNTQLLTAIDAEIRAAEQK